MGYNLLHRFIIYIILTTPPFRPLPKDRQARLQLPIREREMDPSFFEGSWAPELLYVVQGLRPVGLSRYLPSIASKKRKNSSTVPDEASTPRNPLGQRGRGGWRWRDQPRCWGEAARQRRSAAGAARGGSRLATFRARVRRRGGSFASFSQSAAHRSRRGLCCGGGLRLGRVGGGPAVCGVQRPA